MLMKSKYQWIITIFAFTVLVVNSIEGFVIHHNVQNNNKLQVLQDSYTFMSRLGMASSESSSSGNGVESFLQDVHNSGYQFRLVVVGNGAILETTELLGPVMKSSVSPKTGDTLMTFASTDASFEFHVNLNKIEHISFVEKNGMNICRLLNQEGQSACSLILADKSDKAIEWFQKTKGQYEGQ